MTVFDVLLVGLGLFVGIPMVVPWFTLFISKYWEWCSNIINKRK